MNSITNTIPVSQVQIGDVVMYGKGTGKYKGGRFHKLVKTKDLRNGTRVLYFTEGKDMIVLNKGEIIIKI